MAKTKYIIRGDLMHHSGTVRLDGDPIKRGALQVCRVREIASVSDMSGVWPCWNANEVVVKTIVEPVLCA